jgi:hypothetical protein
VQYSELTGTGVMLLFAQLFQPAVRLLLLRGHLPVVLLCVVAPGCAGTGSVMLQPAVRLLSLSVHLQPALAPAGPLCQPCQA